MGSRTESRPILRIRSPVIGRGEQILELGTAPVTLGRAEDCDVVLLEQSASRIHARILPVGDGWELVDEDSHGGVWRGDERIRSRRLVDGDTFRLGDSEIQFVLRPSAQPTVIGGARPHAPASGATPIVEPTLTASPRVQPTPAPPMSPVAPRIAAVAAAPPPPVQASAPSFVDFGPVGQPSGRPSAPSFVDFGAVGRPSPQASAPSFVDFGAVGQPLRSSPSDGFGGELIDDASRLERAERRSGSRFGTWIVVVLLFLVLAAGVAVLVFDVDVVALLGG